MPEDNRWSVFPVLPRLATVRSAAAARRSRCPGGVPSSLQRSFSYRSAGSLYHQRRDGSMDIRLTDNRDSLFVQKGVCCARHNADLTLQGIPALDGNRIAGIFCSQILHGNFQGRNIFQLFRFDLYAHIGIAVRNDVCYLGSFCFCFFISSVSSGSGIGESWMLNFSSSSPSLHMVDQKSNGRGPI